MFRCSFFFLQSMLWYLFLLCSAIMLNNYCRKGYHSMDCKKKKKMDILFKKQFLFFLICEMSLCLYFSLWFLRNLFFFDAAISLYFFRTNFKKLIVLCSIHRTVTLLFLCWLQLRLVLIVFIVDVSYFCLELNFVTILFLSSFETADEQNKE